MKFSTILGGIVGLASVIGGAVADEQQPIVNQGKARVMRFHADYTIKERPDATATDVVSLYNGDSVTLGYTVSNEDDEQVAILGVGGSFKDSKTQEINTNITSASVGPIILEPGQSQQFSQVINVNLQPDAYILSPLLYITHGEEFMTVSPRPQWTTVADAPISFFNPQLLFLELVLVLTFGGIGYVLYDLFGKKYFKGTATGPSKKVSASSGASTAAPSDGKSYDASWIPQGHIKQTKKKN